MHIIIHHIRRFVRGPWRPNPVPYQRKEAQWQLQIEDIKLLYWLPEAKTPRGNTQPPSREQSTIYDKLRKTSSSSKILHEKPVEFMFNTEVDTLMKATQAKSQVTQLSQQPSNATQGSREAGSVQDGIDTFPWPGGPSVPRLAAQSQPAQSQPVYRQQLEGSNTKDSQILRDFLVRVRGEWAP